jgi:general secretion pathway protein D
MELETERTPQQRGLNYEMFNTLSTPMEDWDFPKEESEVGNGDSDENEDDFVIGENFYRKISISATDRMETREILTQAAELAGINIFISQEIGGGVSFSARDRPFIDILKDICSTSGLRFTIDGSSVKIELDSPMVKIYQISSLNMQRDTQSTMTISTDTFGRSMMSDGNGDDTMEKSAAHNGSNNTISGSVKNDFWSEVESSLKAMVGEMDGCYISVHRQAGLITVCTTKCKHREVQKYIKLLREASESQVLIEAKILEVNLKDEFKNGINWSIFHDGREIASRQYDTSGLFSLGINKKNLGIISGFIENFGAVKTLSSPRITILNNHSAVLKVAQNEVVYVPEFQKQYNGRNSDNVTDLLSTNMKSIPIGLIITVHPSIDVKKNTVLLTIRPTISKIVRYKEIPFLFNNYTKQTDTYTGPQMQKIPIVDVREMDSVLKLRSGQIVVMGGLMHEKSTNVREGLPGFSSTKLDFLTSEKNKETEITELVIFLKATIMNGKMPAYHKFDEKIYDKYSADPRKLNFKK